MAFNLDDYTSVQERSNIFWERYPNGAVRTKIISESDTRIIMGCELFRDSTDSQPFATGYAKEVISDRGVNRDFALENCETSARGVAFKAANIGTEKHGPSREEMARVNRKAETFTVENKLEDPVQWTTTDWVAAVPDTPKPPADCCSQGMTLRTGISKTTKKPFYGYVCLGNIKEHAKWASQTSTGAWYFKDKE
jgi:hypothetical protein